MDNIFFANEINKINEFSPDGKYTSDWVGLTVNNDINYQAMTGTEYIFGLKISKAYDGWQFRLMDFITYNTTIRKNIIFNGDRNDYEIAKSLYSGHSISDKELRRYEPKILVHSTTLDGYKKIIKDNTIKSWNIVKKEGKTNEIQPIGSILGDPDDFSNYIMLGDYGYWSELVVSSKQKGYICMDPNSEYIPGARFYFKTKQLAMNGLLIRDGAHNKVKDELPLSYCLFIATINNVRVSGPITPISFANASDNAFKAYLLNY